MPNIIEATKKFVKQQLPIDSTGHDWQHAFRVWTIAKHIAIIENANTLIVELAALLHDIADWKFHNGDEAKGTLIAQEFLSRQCLDKDSIDAVCNIISSISYKGSHSPTLFLTLEGQIVQDADRIEALGAIGIARAFAYGGFKNQPLYDPNLLPNTHHTFEQYKDSKNTTVNHFYEKLLLLKDKMHTQTGRSMAEHRHKFLKNYLEQLLSDFSLDMLDSYESK